jgi:hypothetical protein
MTEVKKGLLGTFSSAFSKKAETFPKATEALREYHKTNSETRQPAEVQPVSQETQMPRHVEAVQPNGAIPQNGTIIPKEKLPEGSDPALKALLKYFEAALDRQQAQKMIADLEINNATERTIFPSLSAADSKGLKAFIETVLAMTHRNDLNDLDPKDPKSIDILHAWKEAPGMLYPVEPGEMARPISRYVDKTLQMLSSKVQTLSTADDIDACVAKHAGQVYYKAVDISKKEFTEPWIQIVLQRAAEISRRDIDACLAFSENPTAADAQDRYDRMIEAQNIIKRPVLAQPVCAVYLKEFKPVLEGLIEFFHTHSKRSKQINDFHGTALDIFAELYEAPAPESKLVLPDTKTHADTTEPLGASSKEDKALEDRAERTRNKALSFKTGDLATVETVVRSVADSK